MVDLSGAPARACPVYLGGGYLPQFQPAKRVSSQTHQKNQKVALHFNSGETGDQYGIVFVGEITQAVQCPPAHKIPAYFKKYQSGIAELNMTPEEFSREYPTKIGIRPTEVRGWE